MVKVVIVGAGIAGASAAYFLSRSFEVTLLERENQPGYHSTGRSAAVYTENYASDLVSAVVRASRSFLTDPPAGFTPVPILSPLGRLVFGDTDEVADVEAAFRIAKARVPAMELHGAEFAYARVPIFRHRIGACFWEPDAASIDVDALLQGYLRGAKRNGAKILSAAEVTAIERRDGLWRVRAAGHEAPFEAPVIVNAAGAWANEVGRLAGAFDIGLQPCRRTALLVRLTPELEALNLPMAIHVNGLLYFRSEAKRLLVSPEEETPVPPCDAQPEEIDIAIAMDRLESWTTLRPERVEHKWAGLRNFVRDRLPVIGWDPVAPDFFWFTGQGGAGIKTSPALGKLTATLVGRAALPEEYVREGIDPAAMAPSRLVTPGA